MDLPVFKYHPDPLFTGSVKPSDNECLCCGQKRGFIYTGPVYALQSLNYHLCPWCIASGEAHQKFDATFQDDAGIENVSDEVVIEVTTRTPGFSGWQQEQWWTHCGDAGAFWGYAEQLTLSQQEKDELIESLNENLGPFSRDEWLAYFQSPENSSLGVYVFRCLHCGKVGGNWDCD